MPFPQMAEGGRWMKPPFEGKPVYVPAKQLGDKEQGHWKRLIADGWMPIDDPRREEDYPAHAVPPATQHSAAEMALQAKVDQLESLVKQLAAQLPAPPVQASAEQARIAETQKQYAAEAQASNDAAREAFGEPAKNTRARR